MQGLATTAEGTMRPVVRCGSCKLVQFVPTSGNCRKCKQPLFREAEVVPSQQTEATPSVPERGFSEMTMTLSSRVKVLRRNRGMSQRDLARKMNVPRTYISKVENGKALPNITSLQRIAEGLQVTLPYLLDEGAPCSFLTTDPFLAELSDIASQLTDIQRSAILGHARGMIRAAHKLKGTA